MKQLVGWLFWVQQPFETVFQSISGRLPERRREKREVIDERNNVQTTPSRTYSVIYTHLELWYHKAQIRAWQRNHRASSLNVCQLSNYFYLHDFVSVAYTRRQHGYYGRANRRDTRGVRAKVHLQPAHSRKKEKRLPRPLRPQRPFANLYDQVPPFRPTSGSTFLMTPKMSFRLTAPLQSFLLGGLKERIHLTLVTSRSPRAYMPEPDDGRQGYSASCSSPRGQF